ncbi:MAG: caspase family protein, partial [Planctomycetota bacterium]
RADGSVIVSGHWGNGSLVQFYALDANRFPFNPSSQVAAAPEVDPARAERERLAAEAEAERKKRIEAEARQTAELEAERRKRQELEERLLAEAKERERLLAEAKERERVLAEAKEREKVATPQRPQAALKPERRVALVIGNAAYKVSPLDNPVNDATDMAESLRGFGFQTTLLRNATLAQMRDATRRFAEQLPSADVALIFFAGHGIESKPKNYMIPVNAELKFEYELSDQAYDAGVWLDMLESIKSTNAERVNIVILDACRDNNLIGGKRNLGRGLGRMDAPSGTFLAYSTAPGKIAADGGRNERNSPFTKYLLRAMQQPNLAIEEVFKEVRRNVGKDTKGEQVPWESTSLTGFFAFRR